VTHGTRNRGCARRIRPCERSARFARSLRPRRRASIP